MIQWSEKHGKYEGIVNGQVVTRCIDYDRVVRKLAKDYGVIVEESGEEHQVKVSEFSVSERFSFIERFTSLVVEGVIPSMIVTGSGGLGKTRTVMDTLKALGLCELSEGSDGFDYVSIKGYTTARNLYTTLFQNNGKIIIFDDCDSSFKDQIGANIFKAALDSNEKRVITWGAESGGEGGTVQVRVHW